VLAAHGGEIQGLNLQSYLFLRLGQPALSARQGASRTSSGMPFFVFDFKLVTGIDSSAATVFAQIKRSAQERGVKLYWSIFRRPLKKPCDERIHLEAGEHHRRTGSCAGAVRERDHCATSRPRTGRSVLARLFTQIPGPSMTLRS